MTAIHILLVDDQWGASPELLGEALAGAPSATTLFEGTPLEDGSQVYRLVIHAFTGQSVLGNALVNDVTKTLEHLQHLSCQVPLSLVLLDMRFDSGPLDARGRPKGRRGDDRFGAELFRAIREAQKELPLVFLSTYGQDDVGGETVAYLSKSDLTDHALAVCLLRHGRITLEQRRSLLRLQSEVVVAPSTTAAYQAAFEIAPLPLPVMITGETGTGKEILARYIHRSSTRAEGPFVAVNVNAVPRELFEAMFFGHMRGSFTGANEDRPGYFEQADGGTLFLDEVGDLPVELQVKLLRVLETKTIKRLGARSDIHIDVRLVSATNRFDANGEVQGLREDVKFRLCGLAVHLDPLRDRRSDVLPLAHELLSQAAREYGRQGVSFGPSALEALEHALLPGNARELRHCVFSAAARAGSHSMISASMLGLAAESGAPLADRNPSPPEVRSAKVPPLLDVDSGSPATSGRTAVQFDDWLEMSHAIAMPADIDGLLGRKVRLDQVFDELNRQLSALALRVTRNAVTSEYAVTAAAQLLFNDPRLKGNVPSRKLAAMLGFNQDKKFAEAELDDQVSKVLDALAEDKSRPH
jgi:DNA-binding NtrC family response regulator